MLPTEPGRPVQLERPTARCKLVGRGQGIGYGEADRHKGCVVAERSQCWLDCVLTFEVRELIRFLFTYLFVQ